MPQAFVAERPRLHLAELLHCTTLSARSTHETITPSRRQSSDPMFKASDDDERRVLDEWTHSRSRGGEPARDRGALVTALLRALAPSACGVVQMGAAAAVFGAAQAAQGTPLAELVANLDRLEAALLSALVEPGRAGGSTSAGSHTSAQQVHDRCSVARSAAIAAYGQTIAERARSRARSARHDIVNAIGAVRNSMLIMDDELAGSKRVRLRMIARRNSRRSEALVRSYFADDSVLTGAVGWADVEPDRNPTRQDSSSESPNGAMMDVAAALAIASILERAGAKSTSSSGVMEVVQPADSPRWRADALAAFQALATTLGVQFEHDAESGAFRFRLPLVARHSRDDLGSSGESHDRDAVGF